MASTELEPFVTEDGEIVLSPEVAQRVRDLLSLLPVEDGGGSDLLIEQLLMADTWQQLNDPWESTSGKLLIGKFVRIDSAQLRPSEFEGGMGAFLVVKGADMATKERLVWTTSALAVVTQIARLNAEGWLPGYANIVEAKRPTKRGFKPYHLQFVPPPADATP